MIWTAAALANPTGTQIVVDETLESTPSAAWVGYGTAKVMQNIQQDPVWGTHAGEVAARQKLVATWREFREMKERKRKRKGIDVSDPYLGALVSVDDVGLLPEYVWVFCREPDWERPEGLRLKDFQEWKTTALEAHECQTRVAVVGLPVAAGEPPTTREIEAAHDAGDQAHAAALASDVLDVRPEDTEALWFRGNSLHNEATLLSDPDARSVLFDLVERDLNLLVSTSPDSSLAKLTLQIFGSGPRLELPSYPCTESGTEMLATAERHYTAKDMEAAREAYQATLEECPENATVWVYVGDTYFHQGALSPAKTAYEKAIEIEPCHWMAHRFLADVLSNAGEPIGATRRPLVEALSCNPTYTAGWALTNRLRHFDVQRPRLVEGVATLDSLPDAWTEESDTWRTALQRFTDDGASDVHLRALEVAVQAYREHLASTEERSAFWDQMVAAEDAGLLREAMYVHLYSDDLKHEFVLHRDQHRDDLMRYIDTMAIQ